MGAKHAYLILFRAPVQSTVGPFSLKGKTTLVSEAARGFGFACVRVLAEADAHIALLDIIGPGEALVETIFDHGVLIRHYKTDVRSRPDLPDLSNKLRSRFGGIDIK